MKNNIRAVPVFAFCVFIGVFGAFVTYDAITSWDEGGSGFQIMSTAAAETAAVPIITDKEPAVLSFSAGYSDNAASISYYPLPLTGKTCRALLVPELTRNAQAGTAATRFSGGGIEAIDSDRAIYKSEKTNGASFIITAECRPTNR